MERAACFLASGDLPVAGAALQAFISQEDLKLSALDILTTSKSVSAKYTTLLLLGHSIGRELLAAVSSLLLAGARLYVHQPDGSLEDVQKHLLLSGFTDIASLAVTQGSSNIALVRAKKPQWELGAKSSLSLKSRPAASTVSTSNASAPAPAPAGTGTGQLSFTAAPASAAKKWQISADDEDGEEEVELMDEDELLTEEDKTRPAPVIPAAGDDCEVGAAGRKACANCSCGRAEAEAAGVKVELTQDMLDNPVSACGSCSLGDAFRCGGCPYRGLPAFEPGQKITLGANFLTADA